MHNRISAIVRESLDPSLYRVGFADLGGLLPTAYQAYPRGISIMRRLEASIVDSAVDGPSRLYFDHYHQVNEELANICAGISEALRKEGFSALALSPTVSDSSIDKGDKEKAFDAETLSAPVSHKMLATRSGLGWIGKTDLLVSPDFGPRLRLASILTDAPLPVCQEPIEESRCGSCDICQRICPARAANGKSWKAGMRREEFFDAHKCKENCRMLSRVRLGETISLCGICVAACPRGKDLRWRAS